MNRPMNKEGVSHAAGAGSATIDVDSRVAIATGYVTADKISVGSLAIDKLSASAAHSSKIEARQLTGDAAKAVTTDLLSPDSINADSINADKLPAAKIPSGALPHPLYGHNLPAFTGLDHAFMQVREFHRVFGHPAADVPTLMDGKRLAIRAKWMRSELDEFEDPEKQTVEDQCDAMMDLIYFALGTMVEIGVLPQPVMDIVHIDGNMKKLHVGEDGVSRVIKNDDGKVVKPDGWVAPEPLIAAEIARQSVQRPLCDVGA